MVQPITHVIVSIEKKFQDELITDSGLKLYLDPSYSKENNVAVTAKVVAIPANPHPDHKKIVDNLKVGDEIAMSYQVVASFDFKSDRDQFIQFTEDNDYFKEFINGKGEIIRMCALPTRTGRKKAVWAGVLLNNRREYVDGAQGDEEDVYRWMSQFPFGKTDIYTFDNFFEFEGKEYWKCYPDLIYAKKYKGHLAAVNDRVITKPIDKEMPDQYFIDGFGMPQKVVMRLQDRGRVISGGKDKGIKKDNVIAFNPSHCEKYELFGKNYFLINERLVIGKWN